MQSRFVNEENKIKITKTQGLFAYKMVRAVCKTVSYTKKPAYL